MPRRRPSRGQLLLRCGVSAAPRRAAVKSSDEKRIIRSRIIAGRRHHQPVTLSDCLAVGRTGRNYRTRFNAVSAPHTASDNSLPPPTTDVDASDSGGGSARHPNSPARLLAGNKSTFLHFRHINSKHTLNTDCCYVVAAFAEGITNSFPFCRWPVGDVQDPFGYSVIQPCLTNAASPSVWVLASEG